jgi:hypothetical protein
MPDVHGFGRPLVGLLFCPDLPHEWPHRPLMLAGYFTDYGAVEILCVGQKQMYPC